LWRLDETALADQVAKTFTGRGAALAAGGGGFGVDYSDSPEPSPGRKIFDPDATFGTNRTKRDYCWPGVRTWSQLSSYQMQGGIVVREGGNNGL
jgi:hypothetical protein